jgi:hypothetical protein
MIIECSTLQMIHQLKKLLRNLLTLIGDLAKDYG